MGVKCAGWDMSLEDGREFFYSLDVDFALVLKNV